MNTTVAQKRNTAVALVKSDCVKLLALKSNLLFFAVAGLIFCFITAFTFFIAALIMGTYVLVFTPLRYEQTSASYNYYCALPVNRRQIYNAKYIFAFGILILLVILLSAFSLAGSVIVPHGTGFYGLWTGALSGIVPGICAGTVYLAAALPLNLCLGPRQARMFNMIFYLAAFIGSLNFRDALLKAMGLWLNAPLPLVLLPLLLVLLVPYLAGLYAYSGKEFTEEN